MFATLLGRGFTRFINLFKRGNLNPIQKNRENDFEISKQINLENANKLENQLKTNSSQSNKNSIPINNLNFTPYHTDSPKENRIKTKKVVKNFRHKFTYINELRRLYLNPINKIIESTGLKNTSDLELANNLTEIGLFPNQIQNRIFYFQKSANNPIEDRINYVQLKSLDGYFVSVLDGHGGDFVAEYVNNQLPSKFEERINQIKDLSDNFTDEDKEREYYKFTLEKFEKGEYKFAFIGSCVLCIVVHDNHLYVANCGDSKAKLFRRQHDPLSKNNFSLNFKNKYEPIKISNTHNAGKIDEQLKLREKFKNERDIIIDKGTACYVKGRLQPTRTIGDLFLKHKEFNEAIINNETSNKYSRKMLQNFNGPYIEHLPEILKFELTSSDDYIVLATDGLWDWLDRYDVANVLENYGSDGLKVIDELSKITLGKAAMKAELNVDELDHIPISIRRSIYDDISIILVKLKNQVSNCKK